MTDDGTVDGVGHLIAPGRTGEGEPVAVLESDADGYYGLPVAPGSYIVIASPPGCQPDARRVLVPDGALGEPVDFVLDGDGLLYGRVRGASGGVLTLLDTAGTVIAGADLDDDGGYEIAGLRSGVYTATAVVPGKAPLAEQVEVLPGDALEHDFGLGPADLSAAAAAPQAVEQEANDSPFSPGLHPVAMVRGGTGISGLPAANGGPANGSSGNSGSGSGSGNGAGGVASSEPTSNN